MRSHPWSAPAAGILLLLAVSLLLRSRALHAPFWIDEGLSVGISSHPLADIPSVLRQDGSPPLYYMLLGAWMRVAGDGQATTHVLSLFFALLTIPVAWWAGRSLFGERSGWFAALLATVNPFLTYYAQETRMYALLALLSLVVVALLAHVFGFGRRRWRIPAGLAIAALMYTHNWGLFLAAGSALAVAVLWRDTGDRRALLRDAVIVYGVAAVMYLPWLPTLLFQAAHTGAPWSRRPTPTAVLAPIAAVLGRPEIPLAVLLIGGTGLAVLAGRGQARGEPPARATRLLIITPIAGLVLAWLSSQIAPGFALRYFAVFVGPVLLLAGTGLAHAGRLGVACLAIVLVFWVDPLTSAINTKSNARTLAFLVKPHVRPADLVVSVHPEQAPLLHYYFPPGLRYATPIGPMPDARVFDWRDALERLRRAKPTVVLDDLVETLEPGQKLVLVLPIIRTATWRAPWTRLVRRRTHQWERAADHSASLRRLIVTPRFGYKPLPRGLRAVIYERCSAHVPQRPTRARGAGTAATTATAAACVPREAARR